MPVPDITTDAQTGALSAMRWFRVYDEILDDPKILKLSPPMRWHYLEMLCISNKENKGGRLPDLEDVAIRIRMSVEETAEVVENLIDRGLLTRCETTQVLSVHGWESRQFKSDDVTRRSSKSKAKKKERSHDETGNVPMTWKGNVVYPFVGNGPRTCATEQNRYRTEQNRESLDGFSAEDPVEVPDWMPIKPWLEFAEMRIEMAKADPDNRPWTRRAARNAIGKLAGLRDRGHDVAEILRDSLINRWQGVWEPRNGPAKSGAVPSRSVRPAYDQPYVPLAVRVAQERAAEGKE